MGLSRCPQTGWLRGPSWSEVEQRHMDVPDHTDAQKSLDNKSQWVEAPAVRPTLWVRPAWAVRDASQKTTRGSQGLRERGFS